MTNGVINKQTCNSNEFLKVKIKKKEIKYID